MATATAGKEKAVAARTKAATEAAGVDVQTKGVSRREFLYYIWGASMALLLAETGGALIWFALPRFRAGEFGGVFSIDPKSIPAIDSAPQLNAAGKFWLTNTSNGILALSQVCTHLGCLFKWVQTNNRFECPCHGSKFKGNGEKLVGLGPAPRNLDRFAITVTTPGGQAKTDADGHAVKADGATAINIDTGKKIQGKPQGTPQV